MSIQGGIIKPGELENPVQNGYCHNSFLDEEILYIGNLINGWGHCITNNLARLWFLLDEKMRFKYESCLIGYTLLYDKAVLSGAFLYLLEFLGIEKKRLIKIDTPMAFRKVYLSLIHI